MIYLIIILQYIEYIEKHLRGKIEIYKEINIRLEKNN